MVIGNSFGGWIAAEMALRDTRGRIGALTLLNALGVQPGNENDIIDPRTLAPADIGKLSFADPAFRPDFSAFSDAHRAAGTHSRCHRRLRRHGREAARDLLIHPIPPAAHRSRKAPARGGSVEEDTSRWETPAQTARAGLS